MLIIWIQKVVLYKSFFEVKKLKVAQKNEKNNVYFLIFFCFNMVQVFVLIK